MAIAGLFVFQMAASWEGNQPALYDSSLPSKSLIHCRPQFGPTAAFFKGSLTSPGGCLLSLKNCLNGPCTGSNPWNSVSVTSSLRKGKSLRILSLFAWRKNKSHFPNCDIN